MPSISQNSDPCAACHGSGWALIRVGNTEGVTACECRKERIRATKLAAIPDRFRACRFSTYIPKNDRQQLALDTISADPFASYFLHGAYGSGKTHLAVAQYVKLVELEYPTLFLTTAELFAELRSAAMDPEYVSILLDRARYAERFHLFWDDADKFKVTDFKFEAIFDLVDTLYRRKLNLTVTSNFDLRGLVEKEKVHPAVVRRIDDMCKAVQL